MSVLRPWRRDVRRDIDDELRFHFDARIAELVRQGVSAEEARDRAVAEFGDVDEVRTNLKVIDERLAAQRKRADILDAVSQDIRYATRSVWRTPVVSLTIIVTLALGLGVNAAMFSLLDAILFRPPDGVSAPDDVRRLWALRTRTFRSGSQYWSGYDYSTFAAVEQALAGRADLAIYEGPEDVPLGRGEEPPKVNVAAASASYFRVLGVRPVLGRIYAPDEERLDASAPVTVISDRLWKREFSADRNVVGQLIEFSGKQYTVIGVTPPGFSGVDLNTAEAWVPLGSNPSYSPRVQTSWHRNGNINGFQILMRLPEAANETELAQRATLALRQPRFGMQDTATVAQLGSIIRTRGPGKMSPAVQVAERASVVAILVLVIAFANVVNLLMARAVRRRREIAVRLALGSSAGRLVRLLVSESVQLALLAAVAALAAAWWGGALLRTLLMPEVTWADDPLHWRVLVLGITAALLTGIGAGLIPAWQSRDPDLTRSLKTGAREGGARRSRLRSFLVATQSALSVVLLVGAALFVRSLSNVKALDIGYAVDRLAFVSVSQGNDPAVRAGISNRLLALEDRLGNVPGVERVAYTSLRPKWGIQFTDYFADGSDPSLKRNGFFSAVSPGFFEATGTRILRGRTFADGSAGRLERAVLVNKTMADSLWPNEDPLGQCIRFKSADAPCYQIIGITQTALLIGLKDKPEPHVYVPLSNMPIQGWGVGDVVLRMEPKRLTSGLVAARDLLRAEFPGIKVNTNTMAAAMEPEYRPWQLGATLFTLFGVLAALVAAIGVYSSVSYAVSQRIHEFGVRVALGATVGRIVRDVVGDGVRTVALGAIAGVILAIASGRVIASLLFGVAPSDLAALLVAAGALLVVAAAASVAPAWRAGRSDPVSALRTD
jgi:putative ABC transport system permease protein